MSTQVGRKWSDEQGQRLHGEPAAPELLSRGARPRCSHRDSFADLPDARGRGSFYPARCIGQCESESRSRPFSSRRDSSSRCCRRLLLKPVEPSHAEAVILAFRWSRLASGCLSIRSPSRITGDSEPQQTPHRCHSRNHGLPFIVPSIRSRDVSWAQRGVRHRKSAPEPSSMFAADLEGRRDAAAAKSMVAVPMRAGNSHQ